MPNVTCVEYGFGRGRHLVITSQCVPVTADETLVYTDLAFRYGAWSRLATPVVRWLAQRIIDQDVSILGRQMDGIRRYGPEFTNTPADLIHVFIESIRRELAEGRDPRRLPDTIAGGRVLGVSIGLVGLTAAVLLVGTFTRLGGWAWLGQRSVRDWLLDGSGLVIQGLLVPFLQATVLYVALARIVPAWQGCLPASAWGAFALNVVAVDYAYYWNHRLLHRAGLWRWHAVHHTATRLDVLVTARNTVLSHFLIVYVWINALGALPAGRPDRLSLRGRVHGGAGPLATLGARAPRWRDRGPPAPARADHSGRARVAPQPDAAGLQLRGEPLLVGSAARDVLSPRPRPRSGWAWASAGASSRSSCSRPGRSARDPARVACWPGSRPST